MLIRPTIVRTLAVIPVLIGIASPVSRAQQPPLQLSDFITFMIPEAGPKPEPFDPLAGLTGGGGSAVEQPTDALVYQAGQTTPFAGKENMPGICEPGTIQPAELIDPEQQRAAVTARQHVGASDPDLIELQGFGKRRTPYRAILIDDANILQVAVPVDLQAQLLQR